VGPLPGYVEEAVKSAYNRYMTYLASFGPEEHHLRKKVETELGTKMIHLKMRCSGIGAEWGKVRFFQKLLVPKVQFMPIPASVVKHMFIYPCSDHLVIPLMMMLACSFLCQPCLHMVLMILFG
jgi:hypothetical protein